MHNSSRMHSQQPLFACPAEGPYHHAGYVVGVRWSQVLTKCTVGCQTDPLVINGCWDLPEEQRMTNGGKSTMSSSLHLRIPNSCIIAQDAFFKVLSLLLLSPQFNFFMVLSLMSPQFNFFKVLSLMSPQFNFFKDDSVIAVDSNGFKQYDVLDALHMDRMMSKIESWRKDPGSFLASQSLRTQCSVGEEVFVLIVEGFLIFNYGPLNELMDKRYFLEIPYDVCKERRGSRVYTPPDLPGYFDGYVWPRYLKNRQEMEDMVSDIVFLDGLKSKEDLLDYVYGDVTMEIQSLMVTKMRTALCLWIVMAVLCPGEVKGHKGHGGDHHQGQGLDQDHDHGRDNNHDHDHRRDHEHRRDHNHGHHHPEPGDNGTKPVIQGNGGFAFSLYKQLVVQPDNQGKNLFFSPLSVSLALAALSVGARGQTHQQLFAGLGFNSSLLTQEQVDQAFQTILTQLNQKNGVDLSIGSALFLHNTFKPHPEFLKDMKRFYLSEGFTVDFTNTAEAIDTINKYVGGKTRGKIDKLVKDLDPSTVMYLLSYIYFKGKWEIPFDSKDTKEDTFHVDDNTTVPVQMMSVKKRFSVYYDQEISTSILQLHYNESVSMMLALPEKGLASLEEAIGQNHITKWHRWMKAREYQVYVPKMSVTTTYSLKDVLSGMGMPDIFSNGADFSGISEDLKVAVSEVAHHASLDVDEAGATAAAATGVVLMPLSFRSTPVLKFNRPFMVIVMDQETKSILFMGKIINPANK
ncbi:alpha-1-antitrypsin isoform X2 [Oncorhynchus mykiss]|uniref:alpha-1-antitrypsin isoform X2 n=1 Tax=Oncorhynchus mykiss TaxID=8022 RepID=UPI0018784595|nr:alpha-1-antitrypsin isoform X2 [Oncorhynchus mykiss]